MDRLFFGSHSFLKENLIKVIQENLGKDITLITHTNKQRLFLKEYLTENSGIIYNIQFLTMIDLSKKLSKIEPLQDFDKHIILKKILQQKNPEYEGLYAEFSSLIEFVKEHQLNIESFPEEIREIIKKYEKLKDKNYYDREDVHIIAAKAETDFKTDILILYGLKSLGAVHRDVLKKVKKLSKDIFAFVPLVFDSGYYQNYQFFVEERKFFEDLTGSNAEVEKTEDENIKVSSYVYKFDYENLPVKNENIKLLNARNEIEELEYVAGKISELVENGAQFYKIGVVIPDISKYLPFLKEIFKKYKIPYYLLEENRYIDEILYKKLFSLFKIKLENFSKETVLGFLSPDIICLKDFDNTYRTILKAPIRENLSDWKKFVFSVISDRNLENLLNRLNDIPEKTDINRYIDEFSKINEEFIKNEKLRNFLENIFLTLKETPLYQYLFTEEIEYKNFVSIVETFFLQENKENRVKGNTVHVLTPLSAEGNNFKYLFFLNLNSSAYPPALIDEILVSAAELGFSYPYHILMQSLANFSALLDKEKKIFISRLKGSINTSYLAPSVFFEELKRILDKEPEQIEILPKTLKEFIVQNARYLLDGNLKEKYEYINSVESLSEENFRYQIQLKKPIPVTKFVIYAYCPYRFFIDYVLEIKEDEELDRTAIPPYKTGIFVHNLLYEFYKNFSTDDDYIKEQKNKISKRFEEFFEENIPYLIPSYIPFEKLKIEKLKENLLKFIDFDTQRLKNKKLQVAREILEKEFKDNDFIGRIDRTDRDNSRYYYIYDYKTGSINNLNLLKELKNKYIQLLIYKRFLENNRKKVKKIGIFAINDDTGRFIYEVDTKNLTEIENHLDHLINRLKKGYFQPEKNDNCKYCPYIDFCLKDRVKKTEVEK